LKGVPLSYELLILMEICALEDLLCLTGFFIIFSSSARHPKFDEINQSVIPDTTAKLKHPWVSLPPEIPDTQSKYTIQVNIGFGNFHLRHMVESWSS